MTTFKIEQLGAVLEKRIDQRFSRAVEVIIENIRNDISAVHNTFFSILGQKIVGRTGFQGLGDYTPVWADLDLFYRIAREKKFGTPEGVFFKYRGHLKNDLAGMDVTTAFGTPIIRYKKGSFGSGDSGEITVTRGRNGKVTQIARNATGKFVSLKSLEKGLKTRISIEPFPKIKGNITGAFDPRPYFRGDDKKVLYKLANYKRYNDRQVLGPYLNWWINTKIRTVVKKRTK